VLGGISTITLVAAFQSVPGLSKLNNLKLLNVELFLTTILITS